MSGDDHSASAVLEFKAAEQIWQHLLRGERFDALDSELLPVDHAAGYAIQAQLEQLAKEPVAGWKIAGTAEAGRKHINVDTPMGGRIFSSYVFEDNSEIHFEGNEMAVAEAEIVFVLNSSLPAGNTDWSRDQIIEAVGEIRVGLELPDSRFSDFTRVGAACLIADNACARDFVLGPEIIDATRLHVEASADIPTRVSVNDELRTEGRGADALGSPLSALQWLVSTLNGLGLGPQAGQFVTTGVTGMPVPVKLNDLVRVEAGDAVSVSARLI